MNLKTIFKTRSNDWRQSVREVLHLSETIDIAILDLWYRNQDIARAQKAKYAPRQFAMDFVDEYRKMAAKWMCGHQMRLSQPKSE